MQTALQPLKSPILIAAVGVYDRDLIGSPIDYGLLGQRLRQNLVRLLPAPELVEREWNAEQAKIRKLFG